MDPILNILHLAQIVPGTDDLKKGDVQEILAWVCGLLLAALCALVVRYIQRETHWAELIQKKEDEARTREEKIRDDAKNDLKLERDEQGKIMDELLKTLKGEME